MTINIPIRHCPYCQGLLTLTTIGEKRALAYWCNNTRFHGIGTGYILTFSDDGEMIDPEPDASNMAEIENCKRLMAERKQFPTLAYQLYALNNKGVNMKPINPSILIDAHQETLHASESIRRYVKANKGVNMETKWTIESLTEYIMDEKPEWMDAGCIKLAKDLMKNGFLFNLLKADPKDYDYVNHKD